MSYYERSQWPTSGRYANPYDSMIEAFNKLNEAFYTLSDTMMPRVQDRPSYERLPYDRAYFDRPYYDRLQNEKPYYERGYEKPHERAREKHHEKEKPQEKERERRQEKELEKEKQQERAVHERPGERIKENQMTPNTEERSTQDRPLVVSFTERPVMDVLRAFEDPFFKSNWESHSTFDRAHRLLEEMINKGKPNIDLRKNDELLQIPEEFEDVYKEFGERGSGMVSGTSYQTSNITKDGKTVTVVRQSKLNPDGSISTKVSQHFDDGKGQRDTKSRKKKINCKTGIVTDKITEAPEKKAEREASNIKSEEAHKPVENVKKDESKVKDDQPHKEKEHMSHEAQEVKEK